jgi:hypothetical protein
MCENSLTIDDPSKFRGLITTHFIPNDFDPQSGFVDFVGVHATGANNRRQEYCGYNSNIYLYIADGKGIQLQQNSQGVILLGGANPADAPDGPGRPLPLHIS